MTHTGGGLAQMSFQSNNMFESGLGAPSSGFASRRGGSQVFDKRLSMAPPSSISTISENQQVNVSSGPRTSRGHLLAGLRTAPKSPMYPGSAPPDRAQHFNLEPNRQQLPRERSNLAVPHTAVGSSFGNVQRGGMPANRGSMYALPEILAPPEVQYQQEKDTAGMDQGEYNDLMAHGQHLAQQQMLLQQQLMNLTMAQQQMQNMNLGTGGMGQNQRYMQPAMPPQNGFYNQQLRNGMQPTIEEVPGTPGLYSIFNPMTGQRNFMINQSEQNQAAPQNQMGSPQQLADSPPPPTPTFHAQVSPPPESNLPVKTFRSPSPPKSRSPPVDVTPLPPPSSTAFRRGHTKQLSSVTGLAHKAGDGPKSSIPPRTAQFPMTPMTGTFGPGQSRAGEHPIRQPRGPPSLEELVEKPTSKVEGSKNFVARQRRRALNSLVRAGVERRGMSRGSNSLDSPVAGTPPASGGGFNFPGSSVVESPIQEPGHSPNAPRRTDSYFAFSVSSDDDTGSVRSSSGSSVHGAIGEERKKFKDHSRERKSTGTAITTTSVSSEEGIGGKMVEIKVDESKESRRGAPMLVLTSATEKRKSAVF